MFSLVCVCSQAPSRKIGHSRGGGGMLGGVSKREGGYGGGRHPRRRVGMPGGQVSRREWVGRHLGIGIPPDLGY